MKIRQLKSQLKKEELRRRTNSPRPRRRLRCLLLVLLLSASLAALYWANRHELDLYRYRQAESLARQGDYSGAVEKLDRLSSSASSQQDLVPQALLLAGQILEFNLQQYQRALLFYLRLVRDYPQSEQAITAQRQAATIYKQHLRDYSSALTLLQRLVDVHVPDADHIHYQVADCYFLLENYEQARIEFESLLKTYPESTLLPEVQYRIGMAYLLDGQPSKARAAFAEELRRWPESPFAVEAGFALAGVYERQDQLRKALDELRKLKGRYPNAGILNHRINQVKERMARKKKAI